MLKGRLEILVGISGSGKSTYAHKEWEKSPKEVLIVNRDSIRNLLFGYSESNINEYYSRKDLNSLEKEVSKFEDLMIYDGLERGKRVIVDATHLKLKYLERFKIWNVEILITEFPPMSVEWCIKNDAKRVRRVGREVIEKQYKQYISLTESLEYEDFIEQSSIFRIKNDVEKPHCVVFDIDGTLSNKGDRNPYNESLVFNDTKHDSIVEMAKNYHKSGVEVLVCSGRTEGCKEDTLKWLYKHLGFCPVLFMRKVGDTRPDWEIKTEMWHKICEDRYISMLVDDRNQVVYRSRALGFKTVQVEYGNF